jgi:superoxide dismutase, Fe-Mn family
MKNFITLTSFGILLLAALFLLQTNKAKFERINTNMNKIANYKTKDKIKPLGLNGISDEQINDHWNLYQGYVNNVNKLNEELKELSGQGKAGSLLYADRRRRYGFEYNGMILHEYYFKNLTPEKTEISGGKLKDAIVKTWGSFDAWLEDFKNTGKTRGIGWAILYKDPNTGELTNNFIAEHQNGIVAGFKPILVMDVWEHAYMVDHKAGGRGDYINAFIQNINWPEAESRY